MTFKILRKPSKVFVLVIIFFILAGKSCFQEQRIDYRALSMRLAPRCQYFNPEDNNWCGVDGKKFDVFVILHPDYVFPPDLKQPLMAYDGDEGVVMVGGTKQKGQIFVMKNLRQWKQLQTTGAGFVSVVYDPEVKKFLIVQLKGKEKVSYHLTTDNVTTDKGVALLAEVVPKVPAVAPVSPEPVVVPADPVSPEPVVVPADPVPPAGYDSGGIVNNQANGGNFVVLIGEDSAGVEQVWHSPNSLPRTWQVAKSNQFNGEVGGVNPPLPRALVKNKPRSMNQVQFLDGHFEITDQDGDLWTSSDGQAWKVEEFAGGVGTSAEPYEMSNARHVWMMRKSAAAFFNNVEVGNNNYKLVKNIDLSPINNFEPIGDRTSPFKGNFDGAGKTIDNLKIDRPGNDYQGFFGVVEESTIRNVKLTNVNIKGKKNVGGLVARVEAGARIEGSSVSGSVVGQEEVGGLVGFSKGDIKNSHAESDVTGTGTGMGKRYVGGLVGLNNGPITNSYATGNVEGYGHGVGGLVGGNAAMIINSYATGNVLGHLSRVGGLVGLNSGYDITNSYATGSVEGQQFVGGLVGYTTGAIKNTYASGQITKTSGGDTRFGGLVGYKNGSIDGKNYWRNDLPQPAIAGGMDGVGGGVDTKVFGKTDAQLRDLKAADGADDASTGWGSVIWKFVPGEYPTLK